MRTLTSRILGLFRRDQRDARLTEEIATHLDLVAEDHVRRGMSADAARAAARRAFGGVEQVKENYREQRGLPLVQSVAQDVRYGARLLVRNFWFTMAAAVTLALGISATSTVFAIINAVSLRGLPGDDTGRIVHIGTRRVTDPNLAASSLDSQGVSYLDYLDLRNTTRAFSDLGLFNDLTMNVSDERRAPERFRGTYVSANAFRLLDERPVLGRDFQPQDDRPGAQPVVILGYSVWTGRYESDPAVVGRVVRVNGLPSIVIGVMPAGFRFPYMTDVWQPIALVPGLADQARDMRGLDAFGRLADGVGLAQARSDLETVATRLRREYPDTNAGITPTVSPFVARYIGWQVSVIFSALMGAVAFVLLIACVNVANLLLARSAHRSREIAIRASLGATRGRIVRQLLVESVLLAIVGGALGFALSAYGVRLFSLVADQVGRPYWMQFTMDGRVFMFLSAVCLLTGLIFGLAPALHISKTTAREVSEGGRTGTGSRRARRWTSTLVIVELAMTVILLSGAAFYLRSFLTLYRSDRVVDPSPLLTMRLALPEATYPTPERRAAFYQSLGERLGAIRAISSSTVASALPWGGAAFRELAIDGRLPVARERPPTVAVVTIGSGYFETLGLRLVRGRAFTGADGTAGHDTAIVNERFAATYFPNGDPIGHRIRLTSPNAPDETPTWVTIVGISPTVRQRTDGPGPVVYLPFRGQPLGSASLIVRSDSEPGSMAALLREQVRVLDPDLPLFSVMTMEQLLTESRWPQRVFSTLFTIFAGMALVLSMVGLYAVMAYSVSERTREIGVRMALGAQASQVRWLVMRRTIAQLGIALVLGLAGAFAVARFLRGVLQPGATDSIAIAPVAVLFVLVALAACFFPARRATRVDPMVALRYE